MLFSILCNNLQQFAGATGTSIVSAIIAQSQTNSHLSTKVSTAIGSQHAFIVLTILGLINLLILFKAIPKENHSK